MDLKNKVMRLYEDILEPVKSRKIVLLLKYVIIDEETDLNKIKIELPITEETIKKYISDDSLMLNYLNEEELKIFRDKMNKLLNTNDKLRRLIKLVLVQNETDLDRIVKLTPISIDTIKKYMSDKPKLLKYLTEKEVELFLSKLEPIMEKTNPKLQRLVKCILVDGETDFDVIERKAYIKIDTIKKHMEDPKELEKYVKPEELKPFLDKLNKMFEERNNKLYNQELNLVRKIIDDIYNTRYLYLDICARNFMTWDRFELFLNDKEFMDREFPVGTVEMVKLKIAENRSIRERKPRDCFLIEDRINVYYAKEDIYFLNQFDNKRLNFAAHYLASGANIEVVMKHFETSMPVALSILSDKKLEQILKPEHYKLLENCIKMEKTLVENNLIEKRKMLLLITEFLKQNSFDKEFAMTYFQMPEPLFNKVLEESIKLPYITDEIKLEIKNLLNVNEESKVK